MCGEQSAAAVNVVMIAQASSEHSICFAVPSSQAEETKAAVSEAFYREIHLGEVLPIAFKAPVSIIAAGTSSLQQYRIA